MSMTKKLKQLSDEELEKNFDEYAQMTSPRGQLAILMYTNKLLNRLNDTIKNLTSEVNKLNESINKFSISSYQYSAQIVFLQKC